MRQTTSMMGADGTVYDIPDDEMEAFKADFGDSARPVQNFRADGTDYTIPDDEADAFKADFPNAEKTRRISFADGSSKDMTVGEMAEFLRSDEYRNGERYAADREAARAEAENKARVANAGNEPDSPFMAGLKETGRRMFTAEGIRESAEESALAKPYAYANDLANSLVKGLLGGSAKITEGVGTLTGIDAVRNAGRADQQMLERNLPTDMLDTSGGGVVNKVLETGKGVAAVTGEFAPAAIPGVGQAYAASLVGSGAVNRADVVYDEAVANGASVADATSLAMGAGAVDALGNMLLMGKFKGIWGGAQKSAADAAKHGVVRRLLGETARTGAIMGGQAGAGNAIDQMAKAQDFSAGEMAEAALDGFIEGGMFHLVNTGMHAAVRPDWQTKPKGMPDGMARDVLDTAEGRALVASNSPEAAKRMIEVREKGGDVSRKMLRDMGVPDSVAPTVADRNALGDSIAADFKAYREAVTQIKRTKLDGQQYQALSEEVAKLVGTDQSEDYGKVVIDVLGEIKDAKELDDPYRREELVGKAVERLHADENAMAEADAAAKRAEREARKEDAAAAFGSKEFEEQTRAREEREAQNRPDATPETAGARGEAETGKERGAETERVEGVSDASAGAVEEAPAKGELTPEGKARKKRGQKIRPQDRVKPTEEPISEPKDGKKENNDETGRVRDEAPAQPEQGAERTGEPETRPLAGAEKGAEPSKTDGSAQNLTEDAAYFRDSAKGDPALRKIDAAYRAAKTDAERSALKEQFVARIAELRKMGRKVPKDAKKITAEVKASEAEKPKAEAPKADEIEKMTDEELKKRIEDVFNNSEDMEPDEFNRAIKPYRDEQNRRKEASKTDADRQKESLDRAFGDFTDENGKPKTITQLIDNGWRFEKKKVGAAHRYRLVKDGVDAYHDLSSKKVRSLMRPGNYDLNIKAIEEYSNSVHKPDAAETPKLAEAKKTGDTAKPAEAPKKAKPVKADAKKAAKVVESFVSKDATRKVFMNVHHDHEGGVVVATDGRVLIATKHGYDKNAKDNPDNPYPNWRQVVPNYDGKTYEATERTVGKSGRSVLKKTEHPVQKVEVDPAAISDTCKKVAALANKINNKGTIFAALKLPDGKVVIMDAAYLRKVADAMAANGITEIKAVDGKRPILAKNADTTIVAMPLRMDGTDPTEAEFRKGRGGSVIVIDALTGRILSAPERSDNTAMTSRKWADALRKDIESDKTIDADKARKIKREIEKIEKRIAAEDEIDALMDGAEQKAGAGNGGKQPVQLSLNPDYSPLKPEAKGAKAGSKKAQEGKNAKFGWEMGEEAEPTGRAEAKEAPKSPEQEIEERLDLKRLDPKRRSDPKVLEWAKKRGRTVTDGMVTPDAVRAYDEAMTEAAAKVVNKRWFPDMNIVTHKYGEKIKRGQHVLDLRDTAGRTLGWFDPKSKEVHLLPGADPQTVAHEIMWHGTRQYMTERAAKGDVKAQKFLDMMKDVEKNAPQDIKDIVNRLYARGGVAVNADTLLNEYGAWFTMKRGGYELEKAMQNAENRNWFAKGLHSVKEMFKDFLVRHGGNRVDISKVDGMTRDEFVDFLAEQFASGKTLGNIKEEKPAVSTKETLFQKWRRKTYDQNAAVRDLERDIEKKTGKKIAVDDSVEAANALKYGLKEAANMDIQGRMRTLREKLHEGGIHFADLEYYAACKAAAGRDAKIDKRNLDKIEADMKAEGATPDEIDAAKAAYRSSNGSHIDPREARRVVAEFESGSRAQAYKDALAELRKTIDETLQTQVDAGLVSKESAAQWRAEEPDYVPFKNEYDPENGGWNGRGSSMSNFVNPEHRMAKGRQSAAGDIIAHVFMDHQAARHRAIENAVRQKLAKLVRENPELGKVEKLKPDAVKNIEQSDPNVVIFKQNGDSYAIRLEGTRGAAVANAFTGRETLDMKWADKGFEVFGKKISFRNFTRFTAGMATRYSPTFAVRNTLKDNIELVNIVYSERGPVAGSAWMANYAANRAKMATTLAKYVATGKIDASTAEGAILDRYIKAGGMIAGGTRSEAFSSIKDRLDPKAIEKEMKRGKSKVAAAAKHTLNSIAYLNEYAEMATRLGVFATEVQGGKSDAEAALFSRRATVDFNRHGDWTPGFNLVRMFSNSTLGATARSVVALSKNKWGRIYMGAMFANGLAQALIEHFTNADEDREREKRGEATGKDVGEFDRRTSLFYFRKGDKLYKIAQHESPFSLINYAGNCVGRWLCGELSGKDMAKNLGVNAAEIAYNLLPMGSINLTSRGGNVTEDFKAAIVSGIVPSVLQPIAEIAFDMDFKGDSVTKKMFDDFASRSHNGKAHTPDWAKVTAEWIQEHTGGNAGNHKGLDVAPEVVQKLVEGYGKNLLKDVSTAFSTGEAVIKGEWRNLDPRNTPIKRDFVRPLDGNTGRYYSAMGDYKGDRKEFLAMVSRWTPEERKAFVKEHPWAEDTDANNKITRIQELQKLQDGYKKAGKRGRWVKAKEPPTDEQKKRWKAMQLELQAKFLKYAEKYGGEH